LEFQLENQKEREHYGDIGIDGSTILYRASILFGHDPAGRRATSQLP
jgi:hypothetical protein